MSSIFLETFRTQLIAEMCTCEFRGVLESGAYPWKRTNDLPCCTLSIVGPPITSKSLDFCLLHCIAQEFRAYWKLSKNCKKGVYQPYRTQHPRVGEILEFRGLLVAGLVDPSVMEKLLVAAEGCADEICFAKPRGWNAGSHRPSEEGN